MSHDIQEGFRSLMAAKARGRWLADSSLRRYEKHAKLTRQLQLLSPSIRQMCMERAKKLQSCFELNSLRK